MPNWCWNSINIFSERKEDIKLLADLLNDAYFNPVMTTSWTNPLGSDTSIVNALCKICDTEYDGNKNSYSISELNEYNSRGSINNLPINKLQQIAKLTRDGKDYYNLYLECESAWSPATGIFYMVKYLNDTIDFEGRLHIQCWYEESGCGIYGDSKDELGVKVFGKPDKIHFDTDFQLLEGLSGCGYSSEEQLMRDIASVLAGGDALETATIADRLINNHENLEDLLEKDYGFDRDNEFISINEIDSSNIMEDIENQWKGRR